MQKHGDGQAENQLNPDRQHGIFEGHLNGVPKLVVRQKIDVVLEPYEPTHHRQVQTVTLKGIVYCRDEGNQDADADEQRRQTQQIRQIVYAPTPWRGGALRCGISHETNLA